MIKIDNDALMCDLAETYGIYDYHQLPPQQVAVFSLGLNEKSRIFKKMHNQTVDIKTQLLALIADRLGLLFWKETEDARKGINRPPSILDELQGKAQKELSVSFNSVEDFEKERKKILAEIERGG